MWVQIWNFEFYHVYSNFFKSFFCSLLLKIYELKISSNFASHFENDIFSLLIETTPHPTKAILLRVEKISEQYWSMLVQLSNPNFIFTRLYLFLCFILTFKLFEFFFSLFTVVVTPTGINLSLPKADLSKFSNRTWKRLLIVIQKLFSAWWFNKKIVLRISPFWVQHSRISF